MLQFGLEYFREAIQCSQYWKDYSIQCLRKAEFEDQMLHLMEQKKQQAQRLMELHLKFQMKHLWWEPKCSLPRWWEEGLMAVQKEEQM